MKRCLLLIVACVLVAASPASAGWRIDRAKVIAEIVWQQPCGSVPVEIAWTPLPDAVASVKHSERPPFPRCRIWFNSIESAGWQMFCTTMIHEYGHLAGLEHSLNPNSVMLAAPGPDPRCAHRGRPYLELHGVLKPR